MFRRITNVINPGRFQGLHRRRRYFEGYYVKVVDPTNGLAFALIPGLSYDEAGVGHSFVQVVDGVAGRAWYERFDVGELRVGGAAFAKTAFGFSIARNRFSESGIDVDVPTLRAVLSFRQNTPWPRKLWSPGAMGPFSFVPGMQCKHGVVSLHHRVAGSVSIDGKPAVTLSDRAVGYIEKDWGTSFPLRWTWLQTNHFVGETAPACLMVSAGVVPWVTGAFDGHIAAILWRGRLEVFATYNGSRYQQTESGDTVRLAFLKPRPRGSVWLQIETERPRGNGIDLVAPTAEGGMAGKVNESLTATAHVRFGRDTTLLLDAVTHYTGFELGGQRPVPR